MLIHRPGQCEHESWKHGGLGRQAHNKLVVRTRERAPVPVHVVKKHSTGERLMWDDAMIDDIHHASDLAFLSGIETGNCLTANELQAEWCGIVAVVSSLPPRRHQAKGCHLKRTCSVLPTYFLLR